MPPKRKNPKKPPNLAEILKTVQTLNGNQEDVGSTTAKDIEEFLCRKVTVAKFVKADPNLIKNLIDDAVAQSKIFPISAKNSNIEYRTWKTIGDDLSKVLHYRGDIPGPSYFQLLKNAYNLTRLSAGNQSDSKGFTSQEWLDWLHKDSRFLNYDLKIFNEKLIPLGIKRGHILEVNQAKESESDDQNANIRYYMITDHFLSYYKLFRRNRILALQALVNADNGESNESLLAKNVSETTTMDLDDSDVENDNDNSVDAETSTNNLDSSQSTIATNDDMESKKDLDNVTVDSKPNASTIRKEPPTSSPTVASNQPQRVSQRKRFKKTLGPDFVESDTLMMYESSNHSRTRNSQSSSNQSSTSTSSLNQSASQTLSPNPKPLSVATKSSPSASTSASSVSRPDDQTKSLPTSDTVPIEPVAAAVASSSSNYGRWLPSVELCLICKQPYKRCKRYSYIISCQECGSKAHGTCFRTFIGNQPTTDWICTECRPDCVCQICNIVERKPDFYLVCQKCSASYHAHCWREKGHAACQQCKFRFTRLNTPSSSSSPSSSTSKSDAVQSESSPKIAPPKVTATPISSLMMNNSKIVAIKSNSLLQSNAGESNGGGTVSSPSASCHVPSNSASTPFPVPSNSASFQLNGKSLIDKPLLTNDVSGPKPATSKAESGDSETITIDTVKIFKNTDSEENQNETVSETPTVSMTTSETNDDHPSLNVTIKVEEPAEIETTKLSKSTSSKINTKILDPLLKHNKSEQQITNQNCSNANQINNPNSRKSITMDPLYGRRPAQAICYNFQTWLETELKPNRPYDDLTPLSSLPNTISEWTSEEVHRFITTIGHPNEADRFLEKEIDGLSVLLLTREDLLNALSLKIGPALKLLGYLNRLHEEMQQ